MEALARSIIRRIFNFQEAILGGKKSGGLGKQTSLTPSFTKIKPFHEIPHKGGISSALELILSGGPDYLHEHCSRRHRDLGPIYREHLGHIECTFLADTKLIQAVVANEGHYPHHNIPGAWTFYNKLNNVERGLFFQAGEPWAKLRKAFNKVMLADVQSINKFSSDIVKINSDLLSSWIERQRTINSNNFVIEDIKAELCKWSIESTGYMLFGSRIGCVLTDGQGSPDQRAGHLVKSVGNMFSETANFQLLPVELAHRFNLATWKRFESASSTMLRIANEYAEENITRVKRSGLNSLVKDLLDLGSLQDDEVSRSVVDLIIAAADTTSNSLQWMLYLIAKHKHVQSRLLNEIESLLDEQTDIENLVEKAPYLKAFVREASRLYPTAPFLARTLDKDIVLGGYLVPAGKLIIFSLYTTSRSGEYFEDPLTFRPERWLRSSREKNIEGCPRQTKHAYASLPFGIGSRMCIGRRLAELQMCLFISSFVIEFESSLVEGYEDLSVKLKMILCPSKLIKLKLKRRPTSQLEQLGRPKEVSK